MRYLSLLFLQVLVLLAVFPLTTQGEVLSNMGPVVKKYESIDAQPMTNITDMLQGKSGFIWLASTSGLLRFDGKSIKRFEHNPNDPNSLPGNAILALVQDKNGIIWLATQSAGLSRFNPATQRFTNFPHVARDLTTIDSSQLKHLALGQQNNSLWTLYQQDKSKLGELGIDWVKTANEWKLRLLTLVVRNDSHYQYDYYQQTLFPQENAQSSNSHYQQDGLKTELVTRATYSNVGDHAVKPEFGIEVTNNRLDTNAMSGQVGALEPVFGSDVIVKELRSEAFANFVYQANSALSIEGGLTYETSEIKVLGDTSHEQDFAYIKPRLTASYQVDPDIRLTIEAQRRVGQLSFNHFAANSVADQNRTNAGNAQLSPDQTDELATTFDWRFSERGSLKVKAYHQWRSDILEQIIVATDEAGNIEQGLGNAGDATLWGIKTNLKLPVDYFIPHGLIDFSYRITRSNFDDPLIAGSRHISNSTPEWFQFQFRQDLTAHQFSWGIDYWGGYSYDGFLVDEIQTLNANKTLRFFVETTRYFGVKIQLEAINVNTSRKPFTRRFYQDTRAGEYLGKEVAKRERSPYFLLSVFGEF